MNLASNKNIETDVQAVLATVPAPIRTYFASGKIEEVAKALMQEHGFHIDQGAVLERELIFLMLGLKTPDQFAEALATEGGLDSTTVNMIVEEVNQKIFVPLQAQMRAGAAAAPARPAVPLPRYQPSTRRSVPAPQSSSLGRSDLPKSPSAAPADTMQAPRAPWQAPPRPPVRFNEAQPAGPHTPASLGLGRSDLPKLEQQHITDPERELPVGEPAAPLPPAPSAFHQPPLPPPARVPVPVAAHEPAAPAFSSAPLPPRAVLPSAASRPGTAPRPVMPPPPAHEAAIAPGAPVPWRAKTAAPPTNLPGTGAVTPPSPTASSTDPYREPIE